MRERVISVEQIEAILSQPRSTGSDTRIFFGEVDGSALAVVVAQGSQPLRVITVYPI